MVGASVDNQVVSGRSEQVLTIWMSSKNTEIHK